MDEGLYDKYRVIKAADLRHGVPKATYDWVEEHAISPNDEGMSFLFVLRPDRDYHARVALFAYAASVDAHNPKLAEELFEALSLMDSPTSLVPD